MSEKLVTLDELDRVIHGDIDLVDDDGCVTVWIQTKRMDNLFASVTNGRNYADLNDQGYGFDINLYGATWRCWWQKPTAEERKREPWDHHEQ